MPSPVLVLDRAGKCFKLALRIFPQEELGDIVYVELPEVGSEVKHKEQFGVVESVKAGISAALIPAATPACSALGRRVNPVVHAVTDMWVHHLESCPCLCPNAPLKGCISLLLYLQAASDVYSPVSGEVTEVNSALTDDPSTVSLSLSC
jgi:glycine cleavage system H lipoate-binding protein